MKLIELLLEYDRNATIATYGKKLDTVNSTNNLTVPIETLMDKFEQTDPSINKQYVQWLCKQYIAGAFKLNNIYWIGRLLSNFQNVKNRLPIEKRNIDKLTVSDLEQINIDVQHPRMKNHDPVSSFGSDVHVWYNGLWGYLITPLNQQAAQKYSKGTKWCTGAEANNKFTLFDDVGPLFIWKGKDGKKYQCHFNYSGLTIHDDKNDSLSYSARKDLQTNPVLGHIVSQRGYLHVFSLGVAKSLSQPVAVNHMLEYLYKFKNITVNTNDIVEIDTIYDIRESFKLKSYDGFDELHYLIIGSSSLIVESDERNEVIDFYAKRISRYSSQFPYLVHFLTSMFYHIKNK